MHTQSTFTYTPRDYARMESHLDKSGDCWLYVGQPSQGYAEFRTWYAKPATAGVRLRRVSAHVAAFEMFLGPVPEGIFVCHRCDTPRCCRAQCAVLNCAHRRNSPGCTSHLFLGTPRDNIADMVEKGRGVFPGPTNPATGERAGAHVLTEDQVLSIRAEYASGTTSFPKLARKHGRSEYCIWAIVNRRSWKHLP